MSTRRTPSIAAQENISGKPELEVPWKARIVIERHRPNPNELLTRAAESEGKQIRGRLKVFFGAAPGVGKTFAMLKAARIRRKLAKTSSLASWRRISGRKRKR